MILTSGRFFKRKNSEFKSSQNFEVKSAECVSWIVAQSTTYDLIFTHPEVVVDNKKVFKLLKTPLLYRR